jgi:hypothetical protein
MAADGDGAPTTTMADTVRLPCGQRRLLRPSGYSPAGLQPFLDFVDPAVDVVKAVADRGRQKFGACARSLQDRRRPAGGTPRVLDFDEGSAASTSNAEQ